MNRRSNVKHRVNKSILPDSAFVFNHTHDFGGSNFVFDADSVGRYEPVVIFLTLFEFFIPRLFDGHGRIPHPFVSDVARILHYRSIFGEEIAFGNLLVMNPAADRGTDEKYYTDKGGDNAVLDSMLFLLTAVFICLSIRVRWTGDFPLCTVMHKNGKVSPIQAFIEVPEVFFTGCRRITGFGKSLPQKIVEQVYPLVTVGLFHIKMVRHHLLSGIVLEIIQDEVKTILYARQRTVLVDTCRPYSFAVRAVELSMPEILVMDIMEIWKQSFKVFDTDSCQSSESGRLGVVPCVTHDTITNKCLVHVCRRIYNNFISQIL